MAKGKPYTQEFKEHAVSMWMSPGRTVASVARDLGISVYTLHEWRRGMTSTTRPATAGSAPNNETLEQENRRLARELEALREEAAILKKAIAYFAQPPKK